MLPLIEMLNQANGGTAVDQIAKQFGLSGAQANGAIEALLPALSIGLQRNAADANGAGGFLSALASGAHAKYFDTMETALAPHGIADGNNILGHLFGSKDVSRAVATQASEHSGVGQDILKQLLPVLAATLMGGMYRQSSGEMSQAAGMGVSQAAGMGVSQAAGMGGGDNIFGKVIEEMMRQSGGQRQAPEQEAAPVDPVTDNPLGQILEGIFGNGQAGRSQAGRSQAGRNQNPTGDNPLGQILEQLTKGTQTGTQPSPGSPSDNPLGQILEGMFGGGQNPQEAPQRQTRSQPQNPLGDALNDMFKTGKKTPDTYNQGLESIFDKMRRGMER